MSGLEDESDAEMPSDVSEPPSPLAVAAAVGGEDSVTEDDDDDFDYDVSGEMLTYGPRPNPVPWNLRGNRIWNTILPNAYLPDGVASSTRFRGKLSKSLRVFSVAMLPHPRPELENGGKLILPPSVLSSLTQRNMTLDGPMLFKVTHSDSSKVTHCGVLEFIAEEGRCYMPYWRMANIGANEGDVIVVENISAPVAVSALFQPQSVDFLEITNPKALLENTLRNFSCITKGEMIAIRYNSRLYELKVMDCKPADVLNIIECDMIVDFAPAVGLPTDEVVEEEIAQTSYNSGTSAIIEKGTVPFAGTGFRINGKPVQVTPSSVARNVHPRGIPDFEWEVGQLRLARRLAKAPRPAASTGESETASKTSDKKDFTAFPGSGATLGK